MRVLVISHAHPDFSIGGAETAAYNLYRSLKQNADVRDVAFLARTDSQAVAPGAIKVYRAGEYLWNQGIGDWFRLRSKYPSSVLDDFKQFLALISPDVVYVQHYVHIGVEILKCIRDVLPNAFLAMTLHEYLAICNRNGQFVKNKTKRLCYKETIESCSECFPEYSAGDFWMRKHYIQSHFEYVDAFISPSHFLKQRYVDWGISPAKINVIENGQPTRPWAEEAKPFTSQRMRFGFFGQINEYKGVEILLQAIGLLEERIRQAICVEIHGANLETQGQWFQDLIEQLRRPLIEEGCLRWAGQYEPQELHRRMRNVDWVVVPSIWWENSPMVIQEAFVHRKPVICSNIGGMAEKVRDDVDGLHFEVRSPLDLADVIKRAVTEPDLRDRLARNVPLPPSFADCVAAHLNLARNFLPHIGVRNRVVA